MSYKQGDKVQAPHDGAGLKIGFKPGIYIVIIYILHHLLPDLGLPELQEVRLQILCTSGSRSQKPYPLNSQILQ